MIEISKKTYVEALNRLASTDDGKIVLAAIMESVGWNNTTLSSDDPIKTQFFAVKRGVYGAIRSDIKAEHLKKIEFNYMLTHDIKNKNTGK